MAHAKLAVEVPEPTWIGSVSRSYPDAEFRVLAALEGESGGVGLVEVSHDELESVLADVLTSETIEDLELLDRRDGSVLAQFETARPMLLLAARESGVPLEMPFTIRDGEAEWELTVPRDRLSTLADRLDEFGLSYRLDHVRGTTAPERLLSGTQAELVAAAVEAGYYDTPRGVTLTELAERRDIAKSTCSEILHRAEGKIVKEFVADSDRLEIEAAAADD